MKLLGDGFHKLNCLQYVRAICALVVVLYHVEGGVNYYWKFEDQISWFHWGHLGVPMFFCLSGFVISYSGYLRPKKSADFLLLRIARIYPAYLFVAISFIAVSHALPADSFNRDWTLNVEKLIATLFFDFGRTDGYVYVAWTLFYEILFYLSFSLVSFRFPDIVKQRYFHYLIGVGLAVCLCFRWNHIADFLFGVSAFLIAVNPLNDKYSSFPAIALLVVLIAGLFLHSVGLICVVILMIIIFTEKFKPFLFGSRFLLVLGDSSYSIYLIQVLTISASLKLSKLVVESQYFPAKSYYYFYLVAIFFSCVTTVCAGILMRRYVEKPVFSRMVSLKK
jgi:exopolysaccharide production protein ExoZ